MRVLIIIPAFNEERNIISLLEQLFALELEADVLVINDASLDHTSSLVKKMGGQVIDLPLNLGIGGAVQTGYIYAHYHDYDIAVQVDGDGQHDPKYLPALIKPIIDGDADMVVGSRFIDHAGFQSTRARRIGIRFFENLIYLLTRVKFTDPTSGFRACGKDIIHLFAQYYPYDFPEPETLATVNRKGFKTVEIPVIMKERKEGKSSIQSMKTVYYMIKVSLAIIIDVIKTKDKKRIVTNGIETSDITDRC